MFGKQKLIAKDNLGYFPFLPVIYFNDFIGIIVIMNYLLYYLYYLTQFIKNSFFRIGPLQSLDNVNIVAAKDGYKFEKTKDFGILKAKKLSHLQVFATDIESKVPLGNVLLSLSGVENYRSNNILDDTGKITFVGLVLFQKK